jgi:hypothetical protein
MPQQKIPASSRARSEERSILVLNPPLLRPIA